MNNDEKKIIEVLTKNKILTIDTLQVKTGLCVIDLRAAMFTLHRDGLIWTDDAGITYRLATQKDKTPEFLAYQELMNSYENGTPEKRRKELWKRYISFSHPPKNI